jgi:RNA polymerase sigma factor (sigma-70 family)
LVTDGGEDMRCDAKTFAQMYKTVYVDLYRFALCMMQNQQEAEDAVSEAVVAAYENIGKLRNSEAFKSWIFTIVSNICKKRLKKETVWRSYFGEEEYMQAAYEEPDIGLAVDVRKAFFLLEEEEQTIVGLSVFGGYNSNEIGDALKMNPNTVRSKRSRALQKMECVLR